MGNKCLLPQNHMKEISNVHVEIHVTALIETVNNMIHITTTTTTTTTTTAIVTTTYLLTYLRS
jgi:hypothetical protein